MRKLYAFLLTAIAFVAPHVVQAQVSGYTFSQSTGVFTPIAGGILLGSTTSDDQVFVDPAVPLGGGTTTGVGFPIGFNFFYNLATFDRIAINNNGWISLGQSALTPSVNTASTSAYTPLSSTTVITPAQLRNRIAGVGRDIQAQAGASLRVETIGAAPNRQCVIQYIGYKRFGTAGTGDNINFQIILNETSNTVQVVFGTVVLNNTTTTSTVNHVGLGGTAATDFNNRQTTAPHDWNTSIAGTTNAQGLQNATSTIAVTAPASGLTFTWTPPPPCSGVPSPGLISGPAGVICTGAGGTLTLSGYATGSGISFQWRSSATPGGPYTDIAGATNNTYAFTAVATTYYVCRVTCAVSGLSATTSEFVVNVSRPVHTSVVANPATTCSPGTSVITGTVTGGTITSGTGILASSGTINLAIPDNVAGGINSAITVPATNIPNAGSLRVRINVGHSWVGDLRFTLTTPCGNTLLFDRPGVPVSTVGNSDNLGTSAAGSPPAPPSAVYFFDIAGATIIPETSSGGLIAAGTYRPSDVSGAAQNWAGLTFPCSAGGTWTLNVSDNAGADIGVLTDWAIIGPTTGNYVHTLTGPGTISAVTNSGANNSTGQFTVSNLPAGVHSFNFTSTDVLGCSVTTPVSVTVNPTPVITITPAAPVICAGATQMISAGATPAVTQTFSSGTINMAIPDNNATGVTSAPITLPAGINIAAANNLRVSINARHSWVGDLIIRVTSPCGTTFLFDRPGVPASTVGNSNNLGTSSATTPPPAVYIFDLAAATVIPETALAAGFIPTGSYRPSDVGGAAHNWAGLTFPCAGTGNWTLSVSDNAGGDLGVIVDWAILYDSPAPVSFGPVVTGLFTDAAATVPYVAGTPTNVVYAKPTTTTTYTATATLGGCTATSNVTVTVNQLPAITAQPASLAAPICPGFNVTYNLTATGAGLTYQWQISTDNGTTWTNLANGGFYTGVTTSSLAITSVTTGMTNYRYRCIVSGTCPPAVTSNAVTLVVSTPPTITTQPANVTACANANVTFSVVAAGIPTPTIYQWQVSTNGGTTYTNLTTGGSYTATLSLPGVTTAMNNNRYRVIITNSCGQTITSNAGILTVNGLSTVVATDLWTRRICISDTLVPLVGTPVGGSWSGPGVSGFNFIPTATGVGSYTLTYTYTNTAGCTTTDTTKVIVSDCAERIRLLIDDAVIVYPNPNNGQFNLKMNSTLYNYLGMKVLTPTGQLVRTQVFSGLVYGRVIPVDLTNLPAGTYMVKLFYDAGNRTSEKTFPIIIVR